MSWFSKLSSEQDPNSQYIENLAKQNPKPFAKWFSNGEREYIPLAVATGVEPEIEEFIRDEGCQITDYRGGYGICGKRTFRIGKLIEQSRKRDLNELQQKLNSGELYDIERDIKSTNDYYNNLFNTFTSSPFRASSTDNELMIVISQNPYDIAYMSTGRDWTSCMEIGKGSHHNDVYCEVKEGGLIAYLIRSNDTNIQKPLARIAIKRFVDTSGNSIAIPEKSVYGNTVEGFQQRVQEWINSKQGNITPGYYKRQGGEWSDTFPKNMLVAPTLKTTEDQEEILKWLRLQKPIIHTEWIVEDDMAEYLDEEADHTFTFKTEEEARNYVKQNENDYEEEGLREQAGDVWTQKDENDEWEYPRFSIRKKVNDFSDSMQRQAMQAILNADKGTFPIEIIKEIKELFNTTVDKYRKMSERDLWEQLQKKYPELFTEEEYKDMGEDKFLNYVAKLPDDSLKKQQVREQYLNQTSQVLQNPQNFYNKNLKEAIGRYRMSSSIQDTIHSADSMNLYFSLSFDNAAIDPLMALFTKDNQGTQKATPIPENTVQELVNFCTQLPDFQIYNEKPFDPVTLDKKTLTSKFRSVVHLFNMTGTDTPTVQKFYQFLIDNYYSDGLNENYSNINIETLGTAIARLGENGQQFLPWAQIKLAEAQKTLEEVKQKSNSTQHFEYKRAKLNVERFLYIIDALQGAPFTGKYRFYKNFKNWFKSAAEKIRTI